MATILLAEDDDSMRVFLYRALKRAGHKVTAVGAGDTAYAMLQREPFDLLLTDIVMPGMDGIELAKKAARLFPDLKVMFITGFTAVALNPRNELPKAAPVMSKPFHLKELVSEVERFLAA